MSYEVNPEFMKLFELFTSDPNSIGRELSRQLGAERSEDPMLIVTGSNLVLFPGSGRPPVSIDFRLTQRGFYEMTAVSHLGLVVPYLARLRELGHGKWEEAAQGFVAQCHTVQSCNTLSYWRDTVAVEPWAGLEEKIVDLTDYTCATTAEYLSNALANPEMMTFDYIRTNLIEGDGPHAVPISFNDMMAGTFGLTALETVFRLIRWLHEQEIQWERLMVLTCGRAGRPSAGLTWQTNVMCHLLYQASGRRLNPDLVIIAPTAPVIELDDLQDAERYRNFEKQYRFFWYISISSVEMGRVLWPDYPAFRKAVEAPPAIDSDTKFMYEMPVVRSVNDKRAIVSRMRYVMEDPGAQIASAGMQFVIDQLCANGNRPDLVEIPGFTDVDYPKKSV
ncbi:hypothetical protein FHR22_002113 [Sphingopyxis panaciterrae]|uniref:DUF5624 domain-containing protein n=1 Tax=Sphingopyxis panaciterrae TaxID=363841 RepID=UPI0014230CB8|nr:DUF5624 domain-containing protein [Sphingopyxis panaciterrae]NIJ37429.1 hypothetical protein [Sphingopyxis panaciterrae]